jgi:spore coat protein CotH
MRSQAHPHESFLVLIAALGALACNGGLAPSAAAPDASQADSGATMDDASQLFAWSTVPVFDLTVTAERWAWLKAHALEEEYVEAQVAFEQRPLGTVGLRFKGAYGTLDLCFDDQGNQICPKISMKIKFDEFDPTLRFFGLKRLNFHSMLRDPTHLHERLSYELYRAMDVMAPRSSWASLRVNGENQGLFAMVEQIDGRFTDNRWPADGDGNLYKEAWPKSPDTSYYAALLETNEETATHEVFVAFANDLAAAPQSDLRAALGRWTDLDYLYRYLAVDDAIDNWDGITAVYVSDDGNWSGNHNYYFYQQEQRDFFWLIPWDLDNTLVPRTAFSAVPHWDTTPADCSVVYPVFGGDSRTLAPGCDRVFQALAQDHEAYRVAVQQLLDGPFATELLTAKIDQLTPLIAEAVAQDAFGPGTAAWEAAVAQLKSDLPLLRQRLERLRDGVPIVAVALSTTGVNDCESLDDLGVTTSVSLYSNPATTARGFLNHTDALVGSQDLKLEFQYRNELKAWSQWSLFTLPLAGGIADLTAKTGVRLRVKTDQPRTLRLEVESPMHSAADQGVRFGWDVAVSSQPQLVEVQFASAAVPPWAVEQGIDPQDDRNLILANVTGLAFHPNCAGRDASGFIPNDGVDSGFLQIDDIEFF